MTLAANAMTCAATATTTRASRHPLRARGATKLRRRRPRPAAERAKERRHLRKSESEGDLPERDLFFEHEPPREIFAHGLDQLVEAHAVLVEPPLQRPLADAE